jgi:hypothetical protein
MIKTEKKDYEVILTIKANNENEIRKELKKIKNFEINKIQDLEIDTCEKDGYFKCNVCNSGEVYIDAEKDIIYCENCKNKCDIEYKKLKEEEEK